MGLFRTLLRAGADRVAKALPGAFVGALTVLAASTAAAEATGDPVLGARLFLQCRACHTVGVGDPSGVGPNLYDVVGAKAASKPGYAYSAGLKASGLTWTPANLDLWLTKPTNLVPSTKMAFAGVASPKMRQDLIAYLSTLDARSKAAR